MVTFFFARNNQAWTWRWWSLWDENFEMAQYIMFSCMEEYNVSNFDIINLKL